MAAIFGYYINLDERGDFYADVRNEADVSVYEVKAGASLGEDEVSIFVDGYMKGRDDIDGLSEYLKELDVIPADGELFASDEFERRQALRRENQGAPANGEYETVFFEEESQSGFIIRAEDADENEFKAEEWRNGAIVDQFYGTYREAGEWVNDQRPEFINWLYEEQKDAIACLAHQIQEAATQWDITSPHGKNHVIKFVREAVAEYLGKPTLPPEEAPDNSPASEKATSMSPASVLDKLPETAWVTNDGSFATDAPVIAIKRGESGYYPIFTALTADELNIRNGVTPQQREAMLAGSCFGWTVPAADPDHPSWKDVCFGAPVPAPRRPAADDTSPDPFG